jgi:hypothetical protein
VDHENAQIVREFPELMSTDRGLTSALELVHPQAVFDWSASRAPYRGVFHGHARRSSRGASLWTVRDGKIMGAKLFRSKAEALEAVGVPDAASRHRDSD